MLKDQAIKQLLGVYTQAIKVVVKDVDAYYEKGNGSWETYHKDKGSISYGQWILTGKFITEIDNIKKNVWQEIQENLYIILRQEDYLNNLLSELIAALKNYKRISLNNNSYLICKNIQIKYYPTVYNWTEEERKDAELTGEYIVIRDLDINLPENEGVLSVISEFAGIQNKSLINFIIDLKSFIHGKFKQISTKEQISSKKISQKIKTFSWIKEPQMYSVLLCKLLSDYGLIHNSTSLDTFHRAFSGEEITEPLKIKWIKLVKGKLSKPLILKLIDELTDNGLIVDDADNYTCNKRLSYIFVDHKGNEIKNWAQSQSSLYHRKGSTTQEEELKEVIQRLLQEVK